MFLFLFVFLFVFSFAQNPYHVDGVVAVVGSEVVLKSEVVDRASLLAKEKGISPQSQPFLFQRLFERVLQEQIHRLIVLHSAKKDTSLIISFDDIDSELDARVSYFVESFGSVSALEEAMGLDVQQIKEEYWSVVEEELLVDRFRYVLFGDVSVNRKEVVDFYFANKDSFPPSPGLVSCSFIEVPILPSNNTQDSIFSLALSVRDSLLSGLLDFDVAARRFSGDPGSAKNGGDLGFSKRGSFLPIYEKAAFALEVGEISFPIKTVYGFHVILLVDRLGEKIHTKHILFPLKPNKRDVLHTKVFVDSLALVVKNDPGLMDSLSLESYIKYKNNSGVYNNYNKDAIGDPVSFGLQGVGDYSFSQTYKYSDAFCLLYKYNETKSKETNLENNWSFIESIALQQKLEELFLLWIEEQSKNIYVEVFGFQ